MDKYGKSIQSDPDYGKPWLPEDLEVTSVVEEEEEGELTYEDGTPYERPSGGHRVPRTHPRPPRADRPTRP